MWYNEAFELSWVKELENFPGYKLAQLKPSEKHPKCESARLNSKTNLHTVDLFWYTTLIRTSCCDLVAFLSIKQWIFVNSAKNLRNEGTSGAVWLSCAGTFHIERVSWVLTELNLLFRAARQFCQNASNLKIPRWRKNYAVRIPSCRGTPCSTFKHGYRSEKWRRVSVSVPTLRCSAWIPAWQSQNPSSTYVNFIFVLQ